VILVLQALLPVCGGHGGFAHAVLGVPSMRVCLLLLPPLCEALVSHKTVSGDCAGCGDF
jgi:hypothetical protein